MRALETKWLGVLLSLTALSLSCAKAGRPADWTGDGGYYDYADGDADGDSDGDADGDYTDDEEPYVPPEVEREARFTVPKRVGRHVFIPDEARDAVVIVDSSDLSVEVVEVGSRPTHLVTLGEPGDASTVAVINLNSDDVTIIERDAAGTITTRDIDVRPDANALAPSPDGRFIVAYHDPRFTATSGAPHTDQEISVLDTTEGEALSVARAVGTHPWQVVYDQAATKAFIVTEGGINIVDLLNLGAADRSETVNLFEAGTYDAETADIEITPDGTLAIGRRADSDELKVAWLDGSGEERTYHLPAVPTDLDIAEDGSFGVVVLRASGEVGFFDLPLPADPEADPFTCVDMGERFVGVATLSGDGRSILLHTTVGREDEEDDRKRLTLMSRNGVGGWDLSSAVLTRPIASVFTVNGPDGAARTGVVMHAPISAEAEEKPYAYSLVTLPDLMPKLQQLSCQPGDLLVTPDGTFGFLLLETKEGIGATSAEKIDLGSLIVDTVSFSSPTIGAGYAAVTEKVFVAQDHPAGRMTFVGVRDDSIKTVTGYNLGDAIEVSP